jgi:hypothetical protein
LTEIDTTGDSVAQDGPAQPSLDVQLAQERASGGDLRKLISKVTDKVVDERVAWQNRPLDRVYPGCSWTRST